MFPMIFIAAALALLFCTGAFAADAATGTTPRSLLSQAKGLPADFEEHFFDVPLAVRVELDEEFVWEAAPGQAMATTFIAGDPATTTSRPTSRCTLALFVGTDATATAVRPTSRTGIDRSPG